MEYRFTFEGREYKLNKENLDYFINDEENPIKNIDLDKVCKDGLREKKKFFAFLGYNFYIYTKNGEFVISSIDKEYEGLSFNRLQKAGKVDNSYIVLVNVCKHCGSYSVEIEEFEI